MHDTNQTDNPSASPPTSFPRNRSLLISLLCALGAGLLASLLTVVLMLLLRLLLGIPTPVELFGDYLLKHIDVFTFVHLLGVFAPNPKTAPLGLALLGMIGLGTILGLLYAMLARVKLPAYGYRPGRREWLCALAFALAMTLIGTVLFWDELRQNFWGLPLSWATTTSMLGLLADFCLYGALLCLAYRTLLPKQAVRDADRTVQARRQLMSRAGIAALTVGGIGGTIGLVHSYLDRYASYDGLRTATHNDITSPITATNEHYVVTQNTVDPTPNSDLWRLEVTGLVKNPGSYTYAEVQALPSTSRPITLECISNGIGNHLIGTAIWQGVTLRSLLEKHGGPQAGAKFITLYSVDGYNISLPLNEVLEVDPLLAWRMNGGDIPQRHGYPMRALIPGRFGEENPKWLTRVELNDHFIGGLYSNQGWYNGPLHTMSRIDRPRQDVVHGQQVEVGGIAFAGTRSIKLVEVGLDDGTGFTWHQADMQPALSPDSWVLWNWQWQPQQPGSYIIACRATDGTGQLQTDKSQGTVPNGAKGYHQLKINVR